MKWSRLSMRERRTSSSPCGWTKKVPGSAWRSTSRYVLLKAEQATTVLRPMARSSLVHVARDSSHGHRSSSVRGSPADIFLRLASGWKSSPSANS